MLFAFDSDGTLVDSRLDLAESANELLASLGAAPLETDAVAAMVGEGAKVLVERALAARGLVAPIDEALEAFLTIYEKRLVVHTRFYPGAREALDALRGRAPLAVLTNKPSRHTGLLLDALGVGSYFIKAIGIGDEFPRKPDPAGLIHLMSLAGALPATTVLVGDSMVDVETARRANSRLIVALYGLGQFPDPPGIPSGAVTVGSSQDLRTACLETLELIRRDQGLNPT